jgi:hypothetical protein
MMIPPPPPLAIAIVLSAALAPCAVQAAFYQCDDENGNKVFSQTPCGDQPAKIEVAPIPYLGGAPVAEAAPPSEVTAPQGAVSEVDRSIKARSLRLSIHNREGQIKSYQKQLDAEQAELKRRKYTARNNQAGATLEQAIATEMRAVTDRYQIKIDATRQEIEQLQEQLRVVAP